MKIKILPVENSENKLYVLNCKIVDPESKYKSYVKCPWWRPGHQCCRFRLHENNRIELFKKCRCDDK